MAFSAGHSAQIEISFRQVYEIEHKPLLEKPQRVPHKLINDTP